MLKFVNVQNYQFPQIPVYKVEKHRNVEFYFSSLILDIQIINCWDYFFKHSFLGTLYLPNNFVKINIGCQGLLKIAQ
jgi:hypothetical protein